MVFPDYTHLLFLSWTPTDKTFWICAKITHLKQCSNPFRFLSEMIVKLEEEKISTTLQNKDQTHNMHMYVNLEQQ